MSHAGWVEQSPLLIELKKRESPFLPNIRSVIEEIDEILSSRISALFPQFTMHDLGHSFRVMGYMYQLISDVNRLSDLDLVMLIYSALLHDIGMAASDEEIQQFVSGANLEHDYRFEAFLRIHNGDGALAIRDFVRRTHARRSGLYVKGKIKQYMGIPGQSGLDFSDDLAKICETHNSDFVYARKTLVSRATKGVYTYSPLFCGVLLRIGDILDIDSRRTPRSLYELINPSGTSREEWHKHFVIENDNKIIVDEHTGKKRIFLSGECESPTIHRKLLEYFEWINREIRNALSANHVLVDRKYMILLEYPIENGIRSKGYTMSDQRISLNFRAITDLLMGEKIYGSKSLGLREIIQNSIDACRVKTEIYRRKSNLWDYSPKIKIILDKVKNTVFIVDNGIGMSLEVILDYFLNVGVSYYQSKDFLLQGFDFSPISKYGIGFLACFMLSDEITVRTRRLSENNRYDIQMEKGSEYITLTTNHDPEFQGTSIELRYDQFMNAFGNDRKDLIGFLKNSIITDGIDLEILPKSMKISNPLDDVKANDKRSHDYIDVSNYLDGVDGYIEISRPRRISVDTLANLDFAGTAYLLGPGKPIPITPEEFPLSQMMIDTLKITWLEMPILTDDFIDEYERVYDVLEDKEDTIEKLSFGRDVDWVSIFLDSNMEDLSLADRVFKPDDEPLYGIPFDQLAIMGQSMELPTKVTLRTATFVSNDKRDFFLEYVTNDRTLPVQDQLFVRCISVPNFMLTFHRHVAAIHKPRVRINVNNQRIIPDVSRNRLETSSDRILQDSLRWVIHRWALDNAQNDTDRFLLRKYIHEFIPSPVLVQAGLE